jgi:putative oxidoreductase
MIQLLIHAKSFSNPVNIGVLLLRVYASAMMLTHGGPKFMRLLDGNMKFGDPLGIGSEFSFLLVIFSEFFCSILIIIGLGTRLATIPLIITMLVALFIAHSDDPISEHLNIVWYILAYIALMISGSGKYSLDYKFFKA